MLKKILYNTTEFFMPILGDIMWGLIVFLATWITYYLDFLKIRGNYPEWVIPFIYTGFVLVCIVLVVFLVNSALVILNFRKEDVKFIPNRGDNIRPELRDGVAYMVSPVWLRVFNDSSEELSECCATLEKFEQVMDREGKALPKSKTNIFQRIIKKDQSTRLQWAQSNISTPDCKVNIPKETNDYMVEVAALRLAFNETAARDKGASARVALYICGKNEPVYLGLLGWYKIKIRFDYKTRTDDITKDFNGYVYFNIEKDESDEGFYIVADLGSGDPLKDKMFK
jgi:hypothetical protein